MEERGETLDFLRGKDVMITMGREFFRKKNKTCWKGTLGNFAVSMCHMVLCSHIQSTLLSLGYLGNGSRLAGMMFYFYQSPRHKLGLGGPGRFLHTLF